MKPRTYYLLVDDSGEHKKARGVNKNVPATSHGGYKDVFLNKKRLRNLINRIKSKDHRIGT